MTPTVLAVAPHPDDELLGAGATLMALRDAGWRVVVFASSLGSRSGARERRALELAEACRRADFELLVPGDGALVDAVAATEPALLVGPSPHDVHPAHEAAGRAIRDAVEAGIPPMRVFFWGLWGELPLPNLLVGFAAARLAELRHALAAHAGELERARFDRLLEARAAANSVLGAERVFGFGTPGGTAPYAELLTDVRWAPEAGWRLAAPREFDAADPLSPVDASRPGVGWWLHALSVRAQLAAPPR